MNARTLPAAIAVLVVCCAAMLNPEVRPGAVGSIAIAKWPYLPGSRIPVSVDGFRGPYLVRLFGAGRLSADGTYEVPSGTAGDAATLIAGNAIGLAATGITVATPPSGQRDELAVASYDDGIVFHRISDFGVDGVLGIGGAAGDVAAAGNRLTAIDTQGSNVTSVSRGPWSVAQIAGVPLGDQVALDARGDAFVTNRELGGKGGVTRVSAGGAVTSVVTGLTGEGVAVDSNRGLVYVANANDGTVAVVDSHSMRVLRRFRAVARVFSLALDQSGTRLFAVSNQSADPPFAAAGSVVSFDVRARPRRISRSADLTFPFGIAYDRTHRRLFVTDESADVIYVLDPATLRAQRTPLATCKTPWKPYLDDVAHRLYVPCARSSQIDAFDETTLHRIAGAPFGTGGYPLAVAVWHASNGHHT